MTKSISMSISDKAFDRWESFKKQVGMTQNDAMTYLFENVDLDSRINHESSKATERV